MASAVTSVRMMWRRGVVLTGRPHQFSRSRIVSHISLPLGAAETYIQTWLTVVLSKVKLKKCIKIMFK